MDIYKKIYDHEEEIANAPPDAKFIARDWELMPDMLGSSVETFVARVKEKYPHARPRLIHDNGGQFISLDFKRLLEKIEIQQVRTRHNHPQTNGKIERMNKSVKHEAIYPNAPSSYQEACEILNNYAYEYNYP